MQALVVSHELLRVAILWHELWHEGLEEASRLYFTEKDPEGMIATLEPLHDMLEKVCFFLSVINISSCAVGPNYRARDILWTGVWQGFA